MKPNHLKTLAAAIQAYEKMQIYNGRYMIKEVAAMLGESKARVHADMQTLVRLRLLSYIRPGQYTPTKKGIDALNEQRSVKTERE